MADIIRTDKLTKRFASGGGFITAMNDISIAIPETRLTLLKGKSGSGKTTLINALGLLDRPDSGDIAIGTVQALKLSEKEKDSLRRTKMGFIFQSVALVSFLSAFENVEFGLRIAGFSPKQRKARAEECLSLVGLRHRMHHMAHELSGGEQQRVAIARAIAHKPDVLFADEPTAELDTHRAIQVIRIFRDLISREGVTVVLTSHDPNIQELADTVFQLEDGKVRQ